jgi:hypothetical protein
MCRCGRAYLGVASRNCHYQSQDEYAYRNEHLKQNLLAESERRNSKQPLSLFSQRARLLSRIRETSDIASAILSERKYHFVGSHINAINRMVSRHFVIRGGLWTSTSEVWRNRSGKDIFGPSEKVELYCCFAPTNWHDIFRQPSSHPKGLPTCLDGRKQNTYILETSRLLLAFHNTEEASPVPYQRLRGKNAIDNI